MSLWDFPKMVPVVLSALVWAVHCAPPAADLEAPTTGFSQRPDWQPVSQSKIDGSAARPILSGYNFIALLQLFTTVSSGSGKRSGVLDVCTGSLITDRHVLTAAHCCWNAQTGKPEEAIVVTIAAYTLRPAGTKVVDAAWGASGSVSFLTAGRVDWVPKSFLTPQMLQRPWDVCIISLAKRIDATTAIPAWLAPAAPVGAGPVLFGTSATLIGWGRQDPGASAVVTQLKGINVVVVDCKDYRNGPDVDWLQWMWRDGMRMFICTKKTRGGGCHGDSGGPLLIDGAIRGIYIGDIHLPHVFESCTEPESYLDVFLDISAPQIASIIGSHMK